MVQAACLQLLLDRKLGEYRLPNGWHVIAAFNRSGDRAGTHRLISPLLNRFVHLDLDVSAEDWQAWAVTADVAVVVRAFLRFSHNLLFQFDSGSNPRAFPTPRSWQFVSDVISRASGDSDAALVAGCVGDGAAAEFLGFRRLYRELPDIEVALASPETTPVPREPAVLYALVGALVEVCPAGPGSAAGVREVCHAAARRVRPAGHARCPGHRAQAGVASRRATVDRFGPWQGPVPRSVIRADGSHQEFSFPFPKSKK